MKPSVRGYTLIEMMVVIGIVGIIALAAFPVSRSMRERAEFNGIVRDYQAKLHLARSLAVGGAQNPLLGPPPARVRSAGIIMTSPTTYRVFIDADTAAGGEVIVKVVEIYDSTRADNTTFIANPDNQVTIAAPAEIRLNNSGALLAPASVNVVFTNAANKGGRTRTLRLSLSGMSRIL